MQWAEDFRSEPTPHDYDDSYIEQFAEVAETVLEPLNSSMRGPQQNLPESRFFCATLSTHEMGLYWYVTVLQLCAVYVIKLGCRGCVTRYWSMGGRCCHVAGSSPPMSEPIGSPS